MRHMTPREAHEHRELLLDLGLYPPSIVTRPNVVAAQKAENLRLATLLESDTSHQANLSIEPHVQRLEQLVLEALQIGGPMTCDALEVWLDMAHQTISPRCCALRNKGLIVDSGVRHKTRSGRSAAVWRLR